MDETAKLFLDAVHMPAQHRYGLCDTGVFNSILQGYTLAACQDAGLDAIQTEAVMRGLENALSEMTAMEAEQHYRDN